MFSRESIKSLVDEANYESKSLFLTDIKNVKGESVDDQEGGLDDGGDDGDSRLEFLDISQTEKSLDEKIDILNEMHQDLQRSHNISDIPDDSFQIKHSHINQNTNYKDIKEIFPNLHNIKKYQKFDDRIKNGIMKDFISSYNNPSCSKLITNEQDIKNELKNIFGIQDQSNENKNEESKYEKMQIKNLKLIDEKIEKLQKKKFEKKNNLKNYEIKSKIENFFNSENKSFNLTDSNSLVMNNDANLFIDGNFHIDNYISYVSKFAHFDDALKLEQSKYKGLLDDQIMKQDEFKEMFQLQNELIKNSKNSMINDFLSEQDINLIKNEKSNLK